MCSILAATSAWFIYIDPSLPVRRKLLSVLDTIEFSQDIPELLQLDFFERTQIEQVISNCEHVNEQGHTVCNVKVGSYLFWVGFFFFFCAWIIADLPHLFCSKLLHRVLVAEVNALQGMAAIGQRPLLMEVGEPNTFYAIWIAASKMLLFKCRISQNGRLGNFSRR